MDSNGRFLLEKYALSYAPSRKALQYCFSQRKTGRITSESSIVFLDGASNLPGAGRELAFLARLYSGTNKILDAPDLQQIGSIVENYEIIHFSGHAKLYQGKPRLIFHTSQGETYLDSSIIQKWRLRKTCLVTLAGCNTGIGPIFEGETPWGLVPSFLSAGAPSILVSLLPVDDAATGKLTSKFYDLLTHSTSSKAQALRLAQIDLLKALGAEARRRPLSWAPFVLVGDPF
jgi:CHAT domain-containing protein